MRFQRDFMVSPKAESQKESANNLSHAQKLQIWGGGDTTTPALFKMPKTEIIAEKRLQPTRERLLHPG